MKHVFVSFPAALALLLAGVAAAQSGFGDASLRGIYTNVGVIGSHVGGALAACTTDGAGRGSCRQVVSMPLGDAGLALDGQRASLEVVNDFEYRTDPDGTGLATFVITLPDGSSFAGSADFVVTGVETIDGERLVTEAFFSQHEPGLPDAPGASYTHVVSHRIGDADASFATASVHGTYAVRWAMGANLAGGSGLCAFDGMGSYTCDWLLNVAMHDGAPALEGPRTRLPLRTEGSYTVDPDGRGTATDVTPMPDGSTVEAELDFAITGTESRGARPVATELVFLMRGALLPDHAGASMVMPQLSRIGDALTLAER